MSTFHDLADAIRRGAALRPQATNGEYFEETSFFMPFASCAIGAAIEAHDGPYTTWADTPGYVETGELYETFPCLSEQAPVCPDLACGWSSDDSAYLFFDDRDRLSDLINHLNDEHKWARVAIANWLDSLGAA